MIADRFTTRRSHLAALLVLIAVGVGLRAPNLGNPLIDMDEQFYLLVGERMWQGAVPYVDIWDRKPAGLFLLFAAMRTIRAEGVLQYQLVAAAFAIATAIMLALVVRPLAGMLAGVIGGIAYLIWLDLLGGRGGQSPVYYNLLTIIAAACVLKALVESDKGALARLALTSMAAMGIAIQIKPTVVFEGVVFGLALVVARWRLDWNVRRAAGLALALVATALLPTLLVFFYYVLIGHADAYWYANVVSIFERNAAPHAPVWSNLGKLLLVLSPLMVAGVAGLRYNWALHDPRMTFLALWLLAAMIGLFAIKPYYNHYALPVLVPLAAAASLAVARRRLWTAVILGAGLFWLQLAGFFADYLHGTADARADVAATTAIIAPHLNGGCLWVFSGPPILYHTTNACLATRYVFPVHLNYLGEDGAIGVDSAAEVRRTLAGRPAVIATFDGKAFEDANPRTWRMVRATLERDYVPVGTRAVFGGLLHIHALRRDDPVTWPAASP